MPRVPMKAQMNTLAEELASAQARINKHEQQIEAIEKQELIRTSQAFRNMTLWIGDLETYAQEVVDAEERLRAGKGTIPDLQFTIATLAATLRGRAAV